MRDLIIHPEVLPDGALVIRGGLMKIEMLRDSAEALHKVFGIYGVSAWAGNGVSAFDLTMAGPILHTKIRRSTVGRIRSLGLDVLLTERPMHCTIKFVSSPTDIDLKALRNAFDMPEPNPLLRG